MGSSVMFSTAFQANAFQNNAFQIAGGPTPTTNLAGGDDATWTVEELKRIRKLSAKIAERQRKLEQTTKDANASRKQSIRDLVSPVAKVKQSKVQSIQEVKADIPSVDTQELQRSISYLERQRNNILEAVAIRHQQALMQEQLRVMEAKRQEELDDEVSILLLL
jgi:flagellar biosynthesis GTPase FlhF